MINELIIHLGDNKTGSTSIQRVLANRLWSLPEGDIAYPTTGNHNGMAMTLSTKRLFDQRAPRFARVRKAFEESDAEYGIVSAEHFQFVDPLVFKEAIDTYWPAFRDRIRLIAYARPHAGKFLSAFSERVKLGMTAPSLEELFEVTTKETAFDYTPRFEKWREVFGDRFTLRPFIRDQLYQGDAVTDFLKTALRREDFEVTGPLQSNPSLTLSQLSLLRLMHQHLRESHRAFQQPRNLLEPRKELGRGVAEYILANGLGADAPKPRMPAALIGRFQERYAADAAALDRAFFDGTPMSDALRAASGKVTDEAQSLEAEDYFGPEVILSVKAFTELLAELMAAHPTDFKQAIADARVKMSAKA